MELNEAIEKLKKIVKFSHLENQKHIDLTLAIAEDRYYCEQALVVAKTAVKDGQLTEQELKKRLGLI